MYFFLSYKITGSNYRYLLIAILYVQALCFLIRGLRLKREGGERSEARQLSFYLFYLFIFYTRYNFYSSLI